MSKTLDHSPARIVRQLLIDLSIGVEPAFHAGAYSGGDWPAFYGAEPPVPDDVLVVNDSTGEQEGVTFDGEIQERFGFQIMVRSIDHDVGWLKAFGLRAALSELGSNRNVVVGSKSYLVRAVVGMGQVMVVGKEVPTSKRSLFTVNAMAAIRQHV